MWANDWLEFLPGNMTLTEYQITFYMTVYSAHTYTQADPRLPQHIAYIYEILHCNHFIILSNATAYETTTIANSIFHVYSLCQKICTYNNYDFLWPPGQGGPKIHSLTEGGGHKCTGSMNKFACKLLGYIVYLYVLLFWQRLYTWLESL